jgi:PadR family transcriptional regulator, regulatory protein PadR
VVTAEDDIQDAQQRKFQKELNAGIVSLVLLSILADAREPLYGYQIAKQLERDGTGTAIMKQGTLYPVLRALSAGGFLESQVEPSVAGPPRRYYRITDAGRHVLAQWKTAWASTRDFVDSILEGSPS